MTQARGFFQELLFAFEASYGATATSGQYIKLPFNSLGLGSDEDFIQPNTITGNRFDVEPVLGNISCGGSITVPLDVRNIGYWLKLMMGEPVTTGSGTYTHTFTSSTTIPSATIERGHPDIGSYHLFNGCKLNSMAFDFTKGQELVVSMNILGKGETLGTTSVDGDPGEEVFNRFNAKGVSVTEGGGATTIIRNVSVNVSNELDGEVYTLDGTGFRDSLPEAGFMVNGNYRALFNDQALYTKMINNTETSLTVVVSDGTNSLTLQMDEIKYPRKMPEDNGAGVINLPVEFKSYSQDDADSPLTIILVNDVASY